MSSKSGIGLKFLQWFIRGIQFGCAALILAIYSYFLASLSNHNFHISKDIKAVEGISGIAVLYTLAALLLLCCLAGYAATSALAMFLDFCFIGAFIYVAVANKNGASSCNGYLDTPFGKGNSGSDVHGGQGFTALPSFHTACRLQTACFAVAIIAIFFFIFSIFVELALARNHRKQKRYGPSPDNNYTAGAYKQGVFGSLFGSRRARDHVADEANMLPEHTHPNQVETANSRYSYAGTTETEHAHGYSNVDGHTKYETGYGHHPATHAGYTAYNGNNDNSYRVNNFDGEGEHTTGVTNGHQNAYQPATDNYRYEDGVYDRS